jgi:tetratricopeptide (TPR) repeat protein
MIKIIRLPLILVSAVIFIYSCNTDPVIPELPAGAQAISALGDTLYTPQLSPAARRQHEDNLQTAILDYRQDPENADAVIWLGRRTAYLGEYREAVQIFTEGIFKHSDDPRMYRHRGHRYITIRFIDNAIRDFETAVQLMKGKPDEIEPDGLPNALGIPTSTLHTNVWYHLGLAYYLKGDFTKAVEAYRECLAASTNNDMKVATLYWYYLAQRRAGNDEEAGRLLDLIDADMEIIENRAYHELLLVFKGIFEADKLLEASDDALQNATVAYGIGSWHYINGRTERAFQIWGDLYESRNWAPFGFIAAEAELARVR